MSVKKDINNVINGYTLSRSWFDFAFENYNVVNPNHTALLMWFIELSNRLGWPTKFASPASQAMAAIGIKSYNTYKKTFDNLSNWGFVNVIQESKNQWTACVIALSKFDNSKYKALDSSLANASDCSVKICESTEQSTEQSTDSINKLKTINLKPIKEENIKRKIGDLGEEFKSSSQWLDNLSMKITGSLEKSRTMIDDFVVQMIGEGKNHMVSDEARSYCFRWIKYQVKNNQIGFKGKLDGPPERIGKFEEERFGKWMWLNNDWRDTNNFREDRKKHYGIK